MLDVEEQLKQLGDWADRRLPDVPLPARRSRNRRRGGWRLGAAATAAALVIVVFTLVRADEPDDLPLDVVAPSSTSGAASTSASPATSSPDTVTTRVAVSPTRPPASPEPVPLVDGDTTWAELPPLPGRSRNSFGTVWTGRELIVWGGAFGTDTDFTNTGYRYDPATKVWSPLAPSPLSARQQPVMVWTGSEVLICCRGSFSAAAYDPAADRWRSTAPLPIAGDGYQNGVWTGTELLVFGFGDESAYGYDLKTDRWRALDRAPRRLGSYPPVILAGTEVIVGPAQSVDPRSYLVYEPQADRWRELPPLPLDLVALSPSAVFTPSARDGGQLVVWGNSVKDRHLTTGARMRPYRPEWQPIAPAPLLPIDDWWEGTAGSQAMVWNGREVITFAGELGVPRSEQPRSGDTRVLAYDPQSDRWRELARAPAVLNAYGRAPILAGEAIVFDARHVFVPR